MTCGVALAGATLAAGVCALSTLRQFVGHPIHPLLRRWGWPQISEGPGFQYDPSERPKGGATFLFQEPDGRRIATFDSSDNPLTLNEPAVGRAAANAIDERVGDPLATGAWSGPDAIALDGADEASDNSPDTVSSVAAPAQSMRTRLLFSLGDLNGRGFTGP
jgi:hypothetical protein